MNITRAGSQPSSKQPSANFTGDARRDPLFQTEAPSHLIGGAVTFEPRARTAWHTPPLGQVLIITAGAGWVQTWREQKQQVNLGDIVWYAPGEKHWHGATATNGMAHIAIVEHIDGLAADWMEYVSDEQYGI